MPIALISAIALALLLSSNAFSYYAGSSHGVAVRDAYWSTQIATANRRFEEARAASNQQLRVKDETAEAVLVSKILNIKDLEHELDSARLKEPLPSGCDACRIDRRRLERVHAPAARGAAPPGGG